MNPGADATLVNVAYQSAMANAPKDYSKTLESVAGSYDKTMQASSKMWQDIGTVVGIVGADMKANADELAGYAAKGAGLDSESADFLVDEIYSVKDEMKGLGIFGGQFGDRETRKKRAELKQKQQELFAEIDLAAESIKLGSEAVAAGLYDENLSPGDAEMTNAIIKSNLKDKNTKAGHYAKLSRDEKSGELMYTLYDAESNQATGKTMTIKEFNKNIKDNVKDTQNVIGSALGTLENDMANIGLKSKNGVMDAQTKQVTLNKLDAMLQSPSDIKRAMMSKYGYSNTSFFDDIKNPSTLSASLYSTLMNATGKTDNGELLPQGVLEGVKDTDGSGGISKAELQDADNYMVLSSNIVGMKDPTVSKELFKEYTANRMGEAHKYGYGKREITTDSDDKDGFTNLTPNKSSEVNGRGGGYVPNSSLNYIGKNANDRLDIDMGGNKFIWDKEDKVYKLDGQAIPNKLSLFSTIYGEDFEPNNILPMYSAIEDWKADTRLEGTFDEKSNITMSILDQDDNDVAKELNESIAKIRTKENPQGYQFDITRGFFGEGDFTQDAVVLRDANNNEVVFPEGHKFAGQRAAFNVDQDNEAEKQASFDYLMEILNHFNLRTENKELTAADYAAGK